MNLRRSILLVLKPWNMFCFRLLNNSDLKLDGFYYSNKMQYQIQTVRPTPINSPTSVHMSTLFSLNRWYLVELWKAKKIKNSPRLTSVYMGSWREENKARELMEMDVKSEHQGNHLAPTCDTQSSYCLRNIYVLDGRCDSYFISASKQ